jgi:hypothetical protein
VLFAGGHRAVRGRGFEDRPRSSLLGQRPEDG